MESVQSSEEFLEAWKRESAACVDNIFMSLWIDGPTVSGALRQEAVEDVMRIVWYRVDAPDKEEALRKNLDAVKKYTGDLVDKAVHERWQRVMAASR